MNRKVVFIGGGNMAEGIIGGLIAHDVFQGPEIVVDDIVQKRLEYLNQTYGVIVGTTLNDELREAGLVVLAVRPQDVETAAAKLKDACAADTMFLSICAGVTIDTLEKLLGTERKIVKVMPNTMIKAHRGYSFVCVNDNVTADDKKLVTKFLDALGQTMYMDESMYDTFTAFSCSGPFFIYKFVEAMIEAGVYAGFSRGDARNIVIKNLQGVAATLEATGSHPAVIGDAMTSPGGVTIEASQSLCQNGFAGVVMTAVDRAVKKANSLG